MEKTNTTPNRPPRTAATQLPTTALSSARPGGPILVFCVSCVSLPREIAERHCLSVFVTSRRGPVLAVFDTAGPSVDTRRPTADDIDADLLRGVQAYLASLRRRDRPVPADATAWDRFFAAFDPFVRSTVLGCRVPSAEIDDCIQDAWIEITRKLPALHFDSRRGRFKGWLRQLVRRRTFKWKRRADRPAGILSAAHADLSAVACFRFPEPTAACEKREAYEQFHAAFAEFRKQVPGLTFRILQLISLEGRSVAEIVELFGLTPQEVWTLHHRARARLRQFLEGREEFSEKSEIPSPLLQGAGCSPARAL